MNLPSPILWRRRDLLVGAACLLGAGRARADNLGAGRRNLFTIGQLTHGGAWNPRPTALRRLLWEVARRTSIEVSPDGTPVAPSSPDLFYLPFLYWAADGEFPPLDATARSQLARFMTFGGLVLCDGVDGAEGRGADASFRRELAAILPSSHADLLPRDHVIYKSFFLLDRAEGRTVASPELFGYAADNRVVAVITRNDLGGAWARDNFGTWVHEVEPGGEPQRERAFRLGVNLVMYSLCLDYKEDQVHIPFILKKRRR